MVGQGSRDVLRDIHTLFEVGTLGALGDGQLLERFLDGRGPAAEAAFAALVERHGPMVLRVCRRVLGNEHDAQDASQAAFLVLARRAGAVRRRESVASWLHRVALHIALRVKRGAGRRREYERRGGEMAARSRDEDARGGHESWPELHEELERLPERLREPLVLCHLEGLTQEQAARRLGWPLGTVQSRLDRGRKRLRDRLSRRGVTLSVAAVAAEASRAELPAAWFDATTRAALEIAAGRPAVGTVPASVLALVDDALFRSTLMTTLKFSALTLATLGALAVAPGLLGLGGAGGQEAAAPAPESRPTPAPARVSRPTSAPAPVPTIRGEWELLYIAGTIAGTRQGYPRPNLVIPVTGETINLPYLTGKSYDPVNYRGKMPYTLDSGRRTGSIDVTSEAGPDGPKALRGIYQVSGDILTICIDESGRNRPEALVDRGDSETLLILRRPSPSPTAAGWPRVSVPVPPVPPAPPTTPAPAAPAVPPTAPPPPATPAAPAPRATSSAPALPATPAAPAPPEVPEAEAPAAPAPPATPAPAAPVPPVPPAPARP